MHGITISIVSVACSIVLPETLLADEPTPFCREVAPILVSVTAEASGSDIGAVNFNNIRYFSRKNNAAPDQDTFYIINWPIDYPGTTFIFPDKTCPKGCRAAIIRTDHRGIVVKNVRFVSHIVVQPVLTWRGPPPPPPPSPILVFLTSDSKRFVVVSRLRQYRGKYITDIREAAADSKEFDYWGHLYRACLLKGSFLDVSSQSTPNRITVTTVAIAQTDLAKTHALPRNLNGND